MNYTVKRTLHTDFSVFEQNKRAPRSYFIPFSSVEKSEETDYKNERYQSDRVTMLSGDWEFAYFEHLSQIPEPLNTQRQAFDKLTVPSTWQRMGYGQIAYINTRYPFPKKPPHIPADAAVGVYRKPFFLDGEGGQHILTFLGIAGAAAVYLNGQYVGYSEGSHNTAEFDVSPYAAKGENELIVVVYQWSNGTYLECQDMFRENGIFRDVYIVSRGSVFMEDFRLRTSKNSDGTYDLQVKVDGCFDGDTRVHIRAVKEGGETLFDTQAVLNPSNGKEPAVAQATLSGLKAEEWSAELPHIYKVLLVLEQGGREVEAVRTYLGFKDVRIEKDVFRLNGQPIKMLGVNHHDTHMTKGYAMGIADMETDIRLMKAYNCNTVRTSHYPPDPAFLTMCDIYGLYVVDEADIETHGFYSVPGTYRPGRLSNDPKWASHYLDRVRRMYERDKNHPSITMWSLGNESGGYKCQDVCYAFLKKENPEIPVHYEGVNRSKRWAYDVVSHMYASQDKMRKILNGTAGEKYQGKPFFQCEYAHAMGNGPGGLEEYMQLFYASNQFMGGCIWEFADHSVYDEKAKYRWTYGGDHNEPIHDGNFCVDGLFFPDRTPSSGALEMKAAYRPVRAKYIGNGSIELWNTRSFADTADIAIRWEILVNGSVKDTGEIGTILAPGETARIAIQSPALEESGKDVFINLLYSEKESGRELAVEQVTVSKAKLPEFQKQKSAKLMKTGGEIRVEFARGAARFERKKGLVSLRMDGKELLLKEPLDAQHGLIPHIYRGRLDNDQYLMIFWNILGLETAKPKLTSCGIRRNAQGEFVRTSYALVTRGVFVLARATVDYFFAENGRITVEVKLHKVCPLTAELPRFGVHGEFSEDLHKVCYYGRGPEESYSDFKEHTTVGVFEKKVQEMAYRYIKPQDSGNRTEVRFARLTDKADTGVAFHALGRYLNFNATPFTLQSLIRAKHIGDLPEEKVSFVSLDGFVRGTGSGSCGPIPSKEHRIPFGYLHPLSFRFEMKPWNGSAGEER